MTKPAEDLVLTPPPPTVKPSRHITIAIAHLKKRAETLVEKRRVIDKELDEIDAAVLALKV